MNVKIFFFKQKTAYEISACLVGSEMCIRDRIKITPVEFADEVLKIALTKELKKTEWVEVDMSKKDDKSQASIQ